MNFVLTCVLMMVPTVLLAEANVAIDNDGQTFLLQAPGTLSGSANVPEPSPSDSDEQPLRYKSTLPSPLKYKSQRSGNQVESYKFPQYGQVQGRYNPWSQQEAERRLPPSLPPANPNFSNPWDLSGRLPGQNERAYQSPPPRYPYYSSGMPRGGYDPFSRQQGLNPDFPDAIYRDTNPASRPFMDGMLPGTGGSDFDFPFSPFKMF